MTADETGQVTPFRKPAKCPNCGARSDRETYPFCSKRCADVDLNRWFSGQYAIAGRDAPGDTDGADPLDEDDR